MKTPSLLPLLAALGALASAALPLPAADLAFKDDGRGALAFDTGIVKGSLQKDGKGNLLKPISFVNPAVPLDNGYGLLAPYRFLTQQKRWGFGSWDWPRTGKVLPDGAAQLTWDRAPDRPFAFTATYRFAAADTLDFTIAFTPEEDLEKFELFVASYFKQFTRATVYVQDAGQGKPGFVDTPKDQGSRQLFPKNDAILPLIKDGRWKHPPYPLEWTFRQPFQAPLGMKTEPTSGVTALIMAPPEDCFAIAMFEQNAPLGSYYLSLFGRDVKKGQTLTGHIRLIFAQNLTAPQALAHYRHYLATRKSETQPSETRP